MAPAKRKTTTRTAWTIQSPTSRKSVTDTPRSIPLGWTRLTRRSPFLSRICHRRISACFAVSAYDGRGTGGPPTVYDSHHDRVAGPHRGLVLAELLHHLRDDPVEEDQGRLLEQGGERRMLRDLRARLLAHRHDDVRCVRELRRPVPRDAHDGRPDPARDVRGPHGGHRRFAVP